MERKNLMMPVLLSVCMIFSMSCSQNDAFGDDGTNPEKPVPVEYKLVSIDFTPDTEDNFIPVDGNEEVIYFSNSGNANISKTYTPTLVPVDTSFFHTPEEVLPEGSNIGDLMAGVPDIDCTPIVHGLSIHKFRFSFGQKQYFKQKIDWVEQTVLVAPFSRVKITERVDGFRIKATYHAVLENIHSGERLSLNGKWEGSQLVSGYTCLEEIK